MQTVLLNPYRRAAAGTPGSIDVRTAALADAIYARFTPTTSFFTTNIFYPTDTTTRYTVNVARWQLNVPKDATITSATVTVYEAQNGIYTLNSDVVGFGFEQVDNAGQITTHGEADSRKANYGTTQDFNFDGSFTTDDPHVVTLPVAMIQEIVDRASWASGNYVCGWWYNTTNGNANNAQWHGHHSSTAGLRPRLEVEYTA